MNGRSLSRLPWFLVAVVAVVALALPRDHGEATTFEPTATVTTATPVAGANGDTVITTDFPASGSIFSSVLTFIPGSFGLGECPANNPGLATTACADVAVPNGALAGRLDSQTTVGLINGNCTNGLTPVWNLMDSTTDMGDTVTFHDDPLDADSVGEQFEDADVNGLPDGVDQYPEYLTRLLRNQPFNPLDPGASVPLQPIQRTYGQANVGGDDVSLQFVMFPPGTLINGFQPDPNWGFMSVLVIQDTGDPLKVIEPSSITDFCAPNHSVTTLYGITRNNTNTPANEGGHKYVTYPAPGPTGSIILPASEYDADDDGLENTLDTCPFEGNPDGWNPKNDLNAGDNDDDGIPDVCDANDNDGNQDADGDGILNRGDNCPRLANPSQSDLDRDDLGNECEVAAGADPGVPTGHQHTAVLQWGALFVAAINGDSDCSGAIAATDALMMLRYVVELQPFAPCIFVGGDTNCDGAINAVDALRTLRKVAGLTVSEPVGCTPIGDPITP